LTTALITIDTELSALLHQQGVSLPDNFAASITGRTAAGDFGIGWQMDMMDRWGVKGVYFVDPMPGLVYGTGFIADIVGPIIRRGHEVQLHIHTEWLEWTKDRPVSATGRNIGDFNEADQLSLLTWARDALVEGGAQAAKAFRAGNYGANDVTLSVLPKLGVRWDSSFNAAYLGGDCRMSLDPAQIDPCLIGDIIEVPVAGIEDRPGQMRPAQICALSATEMRQALTHAKTTGRPLFSIVSHSFEMLSRDRKRPNRLVMARFEALCEAIAKIEGVTSAGFNDLPPMLPAATGSPSRLPANGLRTALRMAEQVWGTWAYDRSIKPA
jgi:hypothetical protein